MKNSPYLDKRWSPSLWRRGPCSRIPRQSSRRQPEKARLQQRAEVLRDWLTPLACSGLSAAAIWQGRLVRDRG
jgi:hypothetical protein